jgi:hypothetical protein
VKRDAAEKRQASVAALPEVSVDDVIQDVLGLFARLGLDA